MNKLVIALIAILILGGAIWALVFYRENLRGVGSAIKPSDFRGFARRRMARGLAV